MTRTIYLTKEGNIRLSDVADLTKLNCTQEQYEKIVCKSLFEEHCLTPLNNYQDYKDGDALKDEDIPDIAEFDFSDDEWSDSNFTDEQLLNFFIDENKKQINEDFQKEISDSDFYINGKIVHYTPFDRQNLQIMTMQNKSFYFNGVFYSAEELENLYYAIENEILRIVFYKEVLLSQCNKLTIKDREEHNFIEWGSYNEEIAKEMNKFEQPFE